MKKIVKVLIFFFVIMFGYQWQVSAGSLGISASSTTVTTGGSVRISVKANSLAGKITVTSSDSSVLSGGTSGEWIENQTRTYTFKAKSTGTVTVTVKPLTLGDFDTSAAYTTSKSVKIKVVAPREKSTNNNLKALSIDGYELSPSFNKNTTEYTVELPAEVTKIKVNATKESSYASVSGSGEIEVQEGENKIEVVVTSETGAKKTYTILATVKDNNPIIVEVDGKEYTVVKRKDALPAIEGFQEATCTIEETEIPAFRWGEDGILLVGLKGEDGQIQLFRYSPEDGTYQAYHSIQTTGMSFYTQTPSVIPDGYQQVELKIGEETIPAYQTEEEKGYYLLYGENLTSKTTGWYRYLEEEGTLQRLLEENSKEEEPAPSSQDEKVKNMLIVGLAGLSAVLSLALVVVLAKKGKRPTPPKKKNNLE